MSLINQALSLIIDGVFCIKALNRSNINMWLHLTAVDPQNQISKFSFYINQLEQGFDILNRVVAEGEKLTLVQLVDDQGMVNLPIDAFDSSSIRALVNGLESEWSDMVKQPIFEKATNRATMLAFTVRRLAVCENNIARIDPMIDITEALLQRSHKLCMSLCNQVLEKGYQRAISFYQGQLDRAHVTRLGLLQTINTYN